MPFSLSLVILGFTQPLDTLEYRSGGRHLVKGSASAVQLSIHFLPAQATISVGCASGVDSLVRFLVPASHLTIFQASAFGYGRGSFARRSIACVQHVASLSGLWLSFPSQACPVGLVPSSNSRRCFCGFGSGSWASLAFAVGLGVPCLVEVTFWCSTSSLGVSFS